MYYIYLAKSKKNNKVYIGYTSDLRKRLKDHNFGRSKYTKPLRPYELIYYEAFKNKKDAKTREQSLKTQGRQKQFLLNNLRNSLK